jgi:hypothetical protein
MIVNINWALEPLLRRFRRGFPGKISRALLSGEVVTRPIATRTVNAVRQTHAGKPGAHFPKFVLHLSAHLSRTSESYGHQQIYDSSAVFLFEVPVQNSPLVVQELQIGGTSASSDASATV